MTDKKVVIRKDRKCNGCLCPLPKGSKIKYVVGIFDCFFDCYLCNTCAEYLDEYALEYEDDGYADGELVNDEAWHEIKARQSVGNP
jgi:hypothetical protein